MSFLHPYFLFALAGAAAPVLIHLLTRDRIQHIAFSTLRFFAKGAKAMVRRRKFREVLLLLTRAAAVFLLALIFARPFFPSKKSEAGNAVATARVIVADISGSMQRPEMAAALAKESANVASSLRQGQDAGGLVTFSGIPTIEVPLGSDIERLKAAAAAIAPGYGATNISEALRKANEMLQSVQAEKKEILLISDLCREGWSYFKGDWKLDEDVDLTIAPIQTELRTGGAAIAEAEAPSGIILDGQPVSLAVRIVNTSDQPRENLEVVLAINGKTAETRNINIRPHGSVPVRFRHTFDTPGDNLGSITVASALPGADVFYFNVRAIPRIPILLVNGRPSPDPLRDAAFFIERALAPGGDSPFEVRTVHADKLTADHVDHALVAILANTAQAPGTGLPVFSRLLERGGGLLFLPGDQESAEQFNRQFGALAPFKLRKILDTRTTNADAIDSLTRIDYEHPILEVFAHPHHGDLSRPRFARYWETTDTQLSRVLARFADGRPALLERQIGNGFSIGLVSAIDAAWNDLAYQAVFLPLLHQIVRRIAVRTEQQTTYLSGDLIPVQADCSLVGPNGKPQSTSTAGAPGFYQLQNSDGKPQRAYAVNASFSEANPETVAPDEIVAAIERAPGEMQESAGLGDTQDSRSHSIWWFLVCGLIALTFFELSLANHTLRH